MMPLSDHLLLVLNLMLKKGAQLGLANDHGITPLHKACQGSSDGVVLFLLMSGADPEIPTVHKECAIHIACRLGKQRLVEALILNGANMSSVGPDGNAEETARRNGHDSIAEFIHALKAAEAQKRKSKRREEKKNSGKLASRKSSSESGKLVKSSTSPSVHSSSEESAAHKLQQQRQKQHESSNNKQQETDSPSSTSAPCMPQPLAANHDSSTPPSTASSYVANSDHISSPTSQSSSSLSVATSNSAPQHQQYHQQHQHAEMPHPAITALYAHQAQQQPVSGEEDDQSGSVRLTSRRSAKINDLMKIFQSPVPSTDSSSSSMGTSGDLKKRSLDGSKPKPDSPNASRASTPPVSRTVTLASSPPHSSPISASGHSGSSPRGGGSSSSPRNNASPRTTSHVSGTSPRTPVIATAVVTASQHSSPSKTPPQNLDSGHRRQRSTSPSHRRPQQQQQQQANDRRTSPVPSLKFDSRISHHIDPSLPVSAHASLGSHHQIAGSMPDRTIHTSRDFNHSTSGSHLHPLHPLNSLSAVSEEDDVASSLSSRASLLSSRSFSTDLLSDSASDTGSDPKIPSGRRVGDPVTSSGSPRTRDKSLLKPQLDRSTSDILGKVKVRSNDGRGNQSHLKGIARGSSSEFGPRTVQRVTKTQNRTRQTKPFSKMLKDVNLDAAIAMPSFAQPSNSTVNVSDSMVIPSSEFFIEYAKSEPTETPKTPSSPSSPRERQLFSDDPEPTTPHFKTNFFDESMVSFAHWNIVGYVEMKFHPAPVPMIISLLQKGHSVLGLLRTVSGDITFSLDVGERKIPSLNAKKLIKLLQEQNEALKNAKLVAVKDPTMSDQLLEYEKTEKNVFRSICSHKVGIVYVKEGQITEEEILGNKNGSSTFEEFLSCIGTKIDLQGWAGFDGGLDTKKDRTGKHSFFTTWQNFEIMFHVSTYIPLGSGEEKYVERKKHIGNDMTTIIFLDTQSTAFKPPTLAGDFLHNFIVIHPRSDGTFGICVTTRKGTPDYGPSLPPHSALPLGDQLREFLLAKIINAERATLFAPMFLTKRRQARQHWLSGIINNFSSPK